MSAAKLELTHVAARLGLCAAALACAAGLATHANAAVVTFSAPIPVPSNFDGVYLNLLTGATGTSGASVPGWDFNPYNSGTALSFFWNGTPAGSSGGVAGTTTGPYLDLAVGSLVSSASTFSAVTSSAQTAAFQPAGTHLLGFRFYNENTLAVNYGYMTLVSTGSNGFPLTIAGWSYENTGAAITVVPEPSSWLMLSMGGLALGALHLRRQRRERRQQAH
ncbi:MAG: PEP-CTERM sorting domain-containing protein [Rubrivivax sp.]|nr:PEP-CTERM sorting domain-containing protein [Rubrivivax sp.]